MEVIRNKDGSVTFKCGGSKYTPAIKAKKKKAVKIDSENEKKNIDNSGFIPAEEKQEE